MVEDHPRSIDTAAKQGQNQNLSYILQLVGLLQVSLLVGPVLHDPCAIIVQLVMH
jgi:hypothetical protein